MDNVAVNSFRVAPNDRAELAQVVVEFIDQGHRRISRHLALTRIRVLGTVAALEPVRPSVVAAELVRQQPFVS
ncbi:hypothetical protein LWC34_10475 [Kibdelosporangium philippinense]|uniref:Uncharacterized protein n=1 Tax=Kibdelosporangium philippinense TaxID=211113 RepID=A0ABS8Z8B2_9PSEU|nr:hypothetical protein [Kibdelosporangium philippinense]MCE7003253.1 hypothetical protein [Kibdelosporangium philippinense]